MSSMRFAAIATLAAAIFFPSCHSDCKKRNEDLANQVHQYEVDLNQTKAERDESRNREENLQRQVAAARDEARVVRENASNVKAVEAPKAEAPEKVAADAKHTNAAEDQKAVAKKLSSALASTKATVDTKDGKLRVILPLGDSFNSGSADLNANGKKLVKEIAKIVQKDVPADAHLTFVGHTDSDPIKKAKAKFADNKALSLARAKEVMDEFKAVGISAKRMNAEGLGETQPIAAGTGKSEKAKNRRVEVLID